MVKHEISTCLAIINTLVQQVSVYLMIKKSPLSLFHDLKKFASHIPAIFPPINVNR